MRLLGAKGKRMSPRDDHLPGAVLTGHVFPFIGAKTLKRCAAVCKEWRAAVDEDVVWKTQCARLWKDKKNVPKVIGDGANEEPEHLYAFAIYPPSVKLSIKEMKQLLLGRGEYVNGFIEKSEFQRALERTQPKRINGWSAIHNSKWKSSYVYSIVCATRAKITRHELITTRWKMEFKFNGMRSEATFLGDGTYWSTLGNVSGGNGQLRWVFIQNGDGSTFDYTAVRVGDYPELKVVRADDWSYELHNDYVVFRQM